MPTTAAPAIATATSAGSAIPSSGQERSLTKRDLLKADEVFLASTAYGIEGVTGIEGHRYTTYVAKSLVKHLNRLFFPDQQ